VDEGGAAKWIMRMKTTQIRQQTVEIKNKKTFKIVFSRREKNGGEIQGFCGGRMV